MEVAVTQSDQASISIQGEEGHYQLTYRKPHQLYRALSLLVTVLAEADKVEIEEQAAYEDLAYISVELIQQRSCRKSKPMPNSLT
ncbi:glycosyl hydrolase family 20 (GH20) protein [Streptococcus pneumoniae]|nr:glycosyl hydrolase family 20 (GH20) protein [Streptococcus pneumoniae]